LYIRPEKATDLEAGVKSSWLDHKLVLNANLFWTLVKDYQASSQIETSPGLFSQTLSNVGWVRTQGLETEISAAPVTGLDLSLTASYNAAVYRSYHGAPCAAELLAAGKTVCDLTGSPVVGAPKWIATPSFYYRHALAGNLDGFIGADYTWKSWFFGTADNSKLAIVPSMGLLNARIGIGGGIGAHSWELFAWTENALDKHYVIGSVVTAGAQWNYFEVPGNPRTVGATLRFKL
jgi:iron complex outermembrane receptor protein